MKTTALSTLAGSGGSRRSSVAALRFLLAFLAGYLLRVAWERWHEWEAEERGVDLEHVRPFTWDNRHEHKWMRSNVPAVGISGLTTQPGWEFCEVCGESKSDPLDHYYPPGTSWSYTEADPPDPYTERLVG